MSDPCRFTLTVVTSTDGYIARSVDDSPYKWASEEEQARFFADVDAADWGIMGRNTHEAADRPDCYRIVFSTTKSGWLRPNQLWLDPATVLPADLPGLVAHVRPMREGLILGGTRVHDWFLGHDAIDAVNLSVEPLHFGKGLPLFTGKGGQDPNVTLSKAGFLRATEERLNQTGTIWSRWTRLR